MVKDLIQATMNSVKQSLNLLTTFFDKHTTQQLAGKPLDPCDKLRAMLVALKNSGDQLQADVRSIEKKQGTK